MKQTKYTFALEPLDADLSAELLPLLIDNNEETGHFDLPLDVDWLQYDRCQQGGFLRLYTCRQEGVLVGYGIYFLNNHLHYRSVKCALQDTLYVRPEHRQGFLGIRFIKYVEKMLKDDGVTYLLQHSTTSRDITNLFKRLGYTELDRAMGKRL